MDKYFKHNLAELRKKYSLFAFRDCTPEEIEEITNYKDEHNNLPDDVIAIYPNEAGNTETIFRRQTDTIDSTYEERAEYLLLKQTEHMSAIRKMLLFFVVLACIGIAAGVLLAFVTFS